MTKENSKTSDKHRLIRNLSHKVNLNRSDMFPYQMLVPTIH